MNSSLHNSTGTFVRLLGLLGTLIVSVSQAQVLADPTEAFGAAQASGKPVLVVFSGSDWCAPCIRLEREVLSDPAFLQYAQGRFILLKADFPQRNKQAQPVRIACEKLADAYNQEGAFPKLLVISPDKRRVLPVSSVRQTPDTLMTQLQRILSKP